MVGTVVLYCLILILSILLAECATRITKNHVSCLFLLIVLLSLFSGFRSEDVGVDSLGYAIMYHLNGDITSIEFGFRWVIKFLNLISENYTFFFFTVAIITNTFIVMRFWELKDISPFKYSVFFYTATLYFLTMSGIRQWLAVAIIFWATRYIDKGKILRFVLIVLATMTIHTSAMISFIMLFPLVFKKRGKWKWLLRMCTIIITPLIFTIGYRLAVDNYARNIIQSNNEIGLMVPIKLILLLIFVVCNFFLKKRSQSADSNVTTNIGMLVFFQLLVIIASFFGYFFNNVSRIAWYFDIFTPIFYGKILCQRLPSFFDVRIVLKIAVIVIAIYTFSMSIVSETNKMAPYLFFWE